MAFSRYFNKSRTAACIAALFAFTTFATTPIGPAQSADEEAIYLKYDVFVSGLRIATLKIFMNFTDESYTLQGRLKTKGLIDIFASSEFEAHTQGTIRQSLADPHMFYVETESNKGDRQTTITWNDQDVPSAARSYQLAEYRVADIAEHAASGISDPLSGLFSASLAGSTELCTDSYRVYDGRTIFDLTYSAGSRDDFDEGDPGVYRGEAHRCELRYSPVAGLSRRRQAALDDANSNGEESYNVWMAPINSPVLNRIVHVPVGSAGIYDGKQFLLYLDAASISGQPLNIQSQTGL